MIFSLQHILLGESNNSLYMVTNGYLISSIFNLIFFRYQSVIYITFNYYTCFSCKLILMS